jgi:hypothetical protein
VTLGLEVICGGCEESISPQNEHDCHYCKCNIHAFCGQPAFVDNEGEEIRGYGSQRICNECARKGKKTTVKKQQY